MDDQSLANSVHRLLIRDCQSRWFSSWLNSKRSLQCGCSRLPSSWRSLNNQLLFSGKPKCLKLVVKLTAYLRTILTRHGKASKKQWLQLSTKQLWEASFTLNVPKCSIRRRVGSRSYQTGSTLLVQSKYQSETNRSPTSSKLSTDEPI